MRALFDSHALQYRDDLAAGSWGASAVLTASTDELVPLSAADWDHVSGVCVEPGVG